jgi:hypothetical protein
VVCSCCIRIEVGGNWGVRVRGRAQDPQSVTNIYFYAGLEGFGDLRLGSPFNKEVLSLISWLIEGNGGKYPARGSYA